MFGSFNIGTDYTFTQSEKQSTPVSKSKLNASYFGDSAVSEKPDVNTEARAVASAVSDANNQIHDEDNGSDYQLKSTKSVSVTNSFDALAAAVGGVGGKVTKEQLINFLHSLTSDPSVSSENIEEVTFIKGLIAQFDTLSGHSDYITSFADIKEPQDYATVSKEQVTPPIDVRV